VISPKKTLNIKGIGILKGNYFPLKNPLLKLMIIIFYLKRILINPPLRLTINYFIFIIKLYMKNIYSWILKLKIYLA